MTQPQIKINEGGEQPDVKDVTIGESVEQTGPFDGSPLMSGQAQVVSSETLHSEEVAVRHPEFFLYTKLNQNETKNLRKAKTNTEERRALAQIFKLESILNVTPGESPSKVEMLKLDFYYMNYDFCKQNQFSNEKTSTMLAIVDHVFQRMLTDQLKPEVGLRMLREHLTDHII
jgi:hypothetical protein